MGSVSHNSSNLVQCPLCGRSIAKDKFQEVEFDLGAMGLSAMVCPDCAWELGEETAEDIEALLDALEELLRDGK